MTARLGLCCLVVLTLVGLPLLGVVTADTSLAPYLEFPPTTKHVVHAPFSWGVFWAMALFVALVTLPLLARLLFFRATSPSREHRSNGLPWWAWLGAVLGVVSWMLAWTRFPWFSSVQPHTFTPLWVAYILVVSGWTMKRKGQCLLTRRPRAFLLLFPVSAVFWWFFEYLNRFVQTWYYVGAGELTAFQYALRATVCFSTVLPAVLCSVEWLSTFPRLCKPLCGWKRFSLPWPRLAGVLVFVLSALGLALVGRSPNILHPLLWVSPLLIIESSKAVLGRKTLFSGLAEGDWRRLWLPAIAALLCGFFWEMWNVYSLAKWCYSIPYVHWPLIFEMPLLGYAGYLPFGLECVVVAELLVPSIADVASGET